MYHVMNLPLSHGPSPSQREGVQRQEPTLIARTAAYSFPFTPPMYHLPSLPLVKRCSVELSCVVSCLYLRPQKRSPLLVRLPFSTSVKTPLFDNKKHSISPGTLIDESDSEKTNSTCISLTVSSLRAHPHPSPCTTCPGDNHTFPSPAIPRSSLCTSLVMMNLLVINCLSVLLE
jgi:hypothetical protein